jgi:3-dehydroquinate synthase
MPTTVRVNLGERSYDIHIGSGIGVGNRWTAADRVLIVTDSNVDAILGAQVEQAIAATGATVTRTVVPAGEASKCLAVAANVYDAAIASGLDRESVVVALGGGMVGDLAGFVAATYLRGVRFVQIPTSLLAMVDSSVGGKTGVNLAHGKNLVGVFHQPVEVIADIDVLDSMPPREYASGLAEVVKYGIIRDASLFERLERDGDRINRIDHTTMQDIVAQCCKIKADVVSADEREGGLRAILNFGHTMAHALEKAGSYAGMLHGEAVAVGMLYATALSCRERGLDGSASSRVSNLLHALNLPASFADAGHDDAGAANWPSLREAMGVDKKTRGGVPHFVLADAIGEVSVGRTVAEDALRETYEEMVRS